MFTLLARGVMSIMNVNCWEYKNNKGIKYANCVFTNEIWNRLKRSLRNKERLAVLCLMYDCDANLYLFCHLWSVENEMQQTSSYEVSRYDVGNPLAHFCHMICCRKLQLMESKECLHQMETIQSSVPHPSISQRLHDQKVSKFSQ